MMSSPRPSSNTTAATTSSVDDDGGGSGSGVQLHPPPPPSMIPIRFLPRPHRVHIHRPDYTARHTSAPAPAPTPARRHRAVGAELVALLDPSSVQTIKEGKVAVQVQVQAEVEAGVEADADERRHVDMDKDHHVRRVIDDRSSGSVVVGMTRTIRPSSSIPSPGYKSVGSSASGSRKRKSQAIRSPSASCYLSTQPTIASRKSSTASSSGSARTITSAAIAPAAPSNSTQSTHRHPGINWPVIIAGCSSAAVEAGNGWKGGGNERSWREFKGAGVGVDAGAGGGAGGGSGWSGMVRSRATSSRPAAHNKTNTSSHKRGRSTAHSAAATKGGKRAGSVVSAVGSGGGGRGAKNGNGNSDGNGNGHPTDDNGTDKPPNVPLRTLRSPLPRSASPTTWSRESSPAHGAVEGGGGGVSGSGSHGGVDTGVAGLGVGPAAMGRTRSVGKVGEQAAGGAAPAAGTLGRGHSLPPPSPLRASAVPRFENGKREREGEDVDETAQERTKRRELDGVQDGGEIGIQVDAGTPTESSRATPTVNTPQPHSNSVDHLSPPLSARKPTTSPSLRRTQSHDALAEMTTTTTAATNTTATTTTTTTATRAASASLTEGTKRSGSVGVGLAVGNASPLGLGGYDAMGMVRSSSGRSRRETTMPRALKDYDTKITA